MMAQMWVQAKESMWGGKSVGMRDHKKARKKDQSWVHELVSTKAILLVQMWGNQKVVLRAQTKAHNLVFLLGRWSVVTTPTRLVRLDPTKEKNWGHCSDIQLGTSKDHNLVQKKVPI